MPTEKPSVSSTNRVGVHFHDTSYLKFVASRSSSQPCHPLQCLLDTRTPQEVSINSLLEVSIGCPKTTWLGRSWSRVYLPFPSALSTAPAPSTPRCPRCHRSKPPSPLSSRWCGLWLGAPSGKSSGSVGHDWPVTVRIFDGLGGDDIWRCTAYSTDVIHCAGHEDQS